MNARLIGTGASLGAFLGGSLAVLVGALAAVGFLGPILESMVSNESAVIPPDTVVAIGGGIAGFTVVLVAWLTLSVEVSNDVRIEIRPTGMVHMSSRLKPVSGGSVGLRGS